MKLSVGQHGTVGEARRERNGQIGAIAPHDGGDGRGEKEVRVVRASSASPCGREVGAGAASHADGYCLSGSGAAGNVIR